MKEEKKVSVRRFAAIAACLVVLAGVLSCELAGDDSDPDENSGTLTLNITTLKSLVSPASSNQRAIAFADSLTLKLYNEGRNEIVQEKTFTMVDPETINLEWTVPAGTYGKLDALIFNDVVSTVDPVVSGWIFDNDAGDGIEGVVVTAGTTSSVSVVCTPYSRAGDLYPYNLEYDTGGNAETVSLAARGEAWFGVWSNSVRTKITIVPSTFSGSSRGSSPAFEYMVGVYNEEGSGNYLVGGSYTSSTALLFNSALGGFYHLVVAANSGADFTVSAEDVVDLTTTPESTGLTEGRVAWYAVTIPGGDIGPLSVVLSGTYNPAAPLTVTIYDTDSSLPLSDSMTMTSSSSVTATSTIDVTAGDTYFIKVSGGNGSDNYNLSWTIGAATGILMVNIS